MHFAAEIIRLSLWNGSSILRIELVSVNKKVINFRDKSFNLIKLLRQLSLRPIRRSNVRV